MRKPQHAVLWIAVGLLGWQIAQADVTTFTDESVFATQTSSTLRGLPNASAVYAVTTTTGNLKITSGNPIYTNSLSGFNTLNYLGLGGVENFDITPAAGTFALGFSVYEPTSPAYSGCNTTCVDSTFVLKLYSGATLLGTFTIQPKDNTFDFYGFWTSSPITKIEVRETVGTNDNEFFGRFFTGTTLPPPPIALTLKQPTVAGCKSATGTVTLTAPAATDKVVTLTDTLDAATPPASVTILAGSTSKGFSIKTTVVASDQTGTVSATLDGKTVNQPLTVRPIGMLSLAYKPSPVAGGNPVIGTAKLECKAAPGPIEVVLASDNPAVANPVATSVFVPQGLQSATFDVTTSPVLAKATASISGTANGIKKTKVLTVNPAASVSPTSLKFGNVVVGTTSPVLNATLQNKGIGSFAVTGISLTGTSAPLFAQTNDCPATLAAGASCTIGVTFSPAVAGAKSVKLSIATSATTAPLSVSLSGTGL